MLDCFEQIERNHERRDPELSINSIPTDVHILCPACHADWDAGEECEC